MLNFERKDISIRELFDGYVDNGETGGVWAYGEKLNLRPKFQREFCYKGNKLQDVISTIIIGIPIGVMSWSQEKDTQGNNYYECVDGQQRSISICKYLNNEITPDFSANDIMRYPVLKSFNKITFSRVKKSLQDRILEYKIPVNMITHDDDDDTEECERAKLDWFERINITGEKLTPQELRNANYSGPFVDTSKKYFSKTGCEASKNNYNCIVSGTYLRQEVLEKALDMAYKNSDDENIKSIEDYMHVHRNDKTAEELINIFKKICNWAIRRFGTENESITQNQDWGRLYKTYIANDDIYKSRDLKKEMNDLLSIVDEKDGNVHVGKKKGIIEYLLSGDTRFLEVTSFSNALKEYKYREQKGICPICKKHFEFNEMAGDHIVARSNGGQTVLSNLQMLCVKCNSIKSAH